MPPFPASSASYLPPTGCHSAWRHVPHSTITASFVPRPRCFPVAADSTITPQATLAPIQRSNGQSHILPAIDQTAFGDNGPSFIRFPAYPSPQRQVIWLGPRIAGRSSFSQPCHSSSDTVSLLNHGEWPAFDELYRTGMEVQLDWRTRGLFHRNFRPHQIFDSWAVLDLC